MARQESDRDDLYAELRSAAQRWEIQILGVESTVVAGLKGDGRFSVYLSPDNVLHFNAQQELLRAFHLGQLYRTQGTTLARLQRVRSHEETVLQRTDLREPDLEQFLNRIQSELKQLRTELSQPTSVVLRAEPAPSLDPLLNLLDQLLARPLALAPAYPTRRR